MKKIIYLLIILILVLTILNIYKSSKNKINDILIFGLWNDIQEKDEYTINPKIHSTTSININQTSKDNIYKKIAPGSYGAFKVKLEKDSQSVYKIYLEENSLKPTNLIFDYNNKEYKKISDLENAINKEQQEEFVINWKWKYDENEEQNNQDTNSGLLAQKYILSMTAVLE